jgi:hypothetical protein
MSWKYLGLVAAVTAVSAVTVVRAQAPILTPVPPVRSGTGSNGLPFTETYHPDGTLSSQGTGTNGKPISDSGQWWWGAPGTPTAGYFCHKYDHWQNGSVHCVPPSQLDFPMPAK